MSEPLTLPACAHNHPGVASNIKVRLCTRAGVGTYRRASCSVCAEEAAKRGRRISSAGQDYGVVRLSWMPPERALLEELA